MFGINEVIQKYVIMRKEGWNIDDYSESTKR